MEEQKHTALEELRRAEQMFSPLNWVHGELKDIRQEIGYLRQEIKSVENSLRQKIESVEGSLRQDIKQELAGVRTLIWATLALVIGTLGVVVTMVARP